MKKIIKFLHLNITPDTQETEFEYKVGDCVRLNSDKTYKCISVIEIEDGIMFIFKEPKIILDYSW